MKQDLFVQMVWEGWQQFLPLFSGMTHLLVSAFIYRCGIEHGRKLK
jgi:hypothetical protein